MAQNKKPKKKYQPRSVIKDPLAFVLRGSKPAPESAQIKLKISYHMAMLRMTQGTGVYQDWQELANVLNLAVTLCEMGYGQDLIGEIVDSQGAMVMLRDQLKSTGKMTMRSEDMKAINNALAIHDEQIALTPIREMDIAIRSVGDQLAKGNFVKVALAA